MPFWEEIPLAELSDAQWESLCDRCGRCCLQKLEDDETGDVYFTRIACKLLDCSNSQCLDYSDRFSHVPDCTKVRPLTPQKRSWLPATCAYRLIDEGKPLYAWHPLVSGREESVHEAGISVGAMAISEKEVDLAQYEEHIIQFSDD